MTSRDVKTAPNILIIMVDQLNGTLFPDVRQSQARRWVVCEALRGGEYYPWDYQPLQKASER